MTIGIAVKLDNFIGLFADGREVSANKKSETIDDKNKINIINDSIGLIRIGVSRITEDAVEAIHLNYKPLNDIKTGVNFLDQCLKCSWDLNKKNFPHGTSFDDPRLHGSFIGGGIVGNEPFILAMGRNHNSRQSPVLLTGNQHGYLITPKHEVALGDFFSQQMTDNLFGKRFIRTENRNKAAIECAVETIRLAANEDPYVGGVIRYVIKESNKPFINGKI